MKLIGSNQIVILGTWYLLKYTLVDQEGRRKDIAEGIKGQLVYTQDGSVSVVIVLTSPVDRTSQMNTICYSGRYRFEDENIVHEIYVSDKSSYINSSQVRSIDISNNILTLTAPPIAGVTHIVRWQRTEFKA